MNPWLQRFLVSWAAAIVTTGVAVSTSKTPHKLKKKKRKKKSDGTYEPVSVGAVALKDARLPEERSLTMGEWRDNVVATGAALKERVGSLFSRNKPQGGDATAPKDGALEPDEIQSKTGERVANATAKRSTRKGSIAKGRRGRRKRRQQATLWDSAKESLKQTVKDTVREEVKQSPVGDAFETLKSVGQTVGQKVKEGAASAAQAVQQAIDKQQGREPRKEPKNINTVERELLGGEPARTDAPVDEPVGESQKIEPAEVAEKVKQGIDVVGAWLQGPGAPGYAKRVKPSGGGDVVEAKDAPADSAAPAGADSPPAPQDDKAAE